jgi:hypothetical protein
VQGLKLLIAPLLLIPSIALSATFDKWEAGISDDHQTFYAFTLNDSGSIFGEWCTVSTRICVWMVGMDSGCEGDSTYPVLANTDTGAAPLNIKCGGKLADTNLSRYQFQDYKSVEGLLKGSHMIGFAIPMKADQFKVVRFSLSGSERAISAMEAAVAKVVKPKSGDTRNTTL